MRTPLSALFQIFDSNQENDGGKIGEVINNRKQLVLYSITVPFATAAAALMWYYCSSRRQKHKRRVSYTSLGLALGTFPIEASVPEAIINTACYFNDEVLSLEALATEVVEPLLQYERMSQVLDINTGYFCQPLSPFKPRDLIRLLEIDSPDDKLLNQTIFDHLQDSFIQRPSLPWWEILVIKNNGKGPSAVVIRVHHALADGLSLVHAFSPILTTTKTAKEFDSKTKKLESQASIRSSTPGIFSVSLSVLEGILHVLTLGASRYDDDTSFSRCNHAQMKYSGKRDFVIFPTVSLEFIKQLKTAANCTVNTILMTAVSQAIHDYCINQNDPILAVKRTHLQCRALLPLGFPRPEDELSNSTTALTNKWCMVSCDMSVGCDDILDRLTAIHKSTTQIKESSRAIMQLSIQNSIAPLLPRFVARQAVMDVFCRHSLVLTNVPGPDVTCSLAGVTVSGVQLFFSNLLSQVDLLSYSGQVYGNIVFDPDALPEFHDFGRLYAKALVLLAERLGVNAPSSLSE